MGQFEDMFAFVRIVEAGSISRAAEQVGTTKSMLSRRLSDLEHRLGVQLLQRTTRQSSLTDVGAQFYQRALTILADVEELNAATSQTKVELSGNLKLAVPLSFGLGHLAPALRQFSKDHPNLNLQVDFADRQVDLVEEGFDVAIRIAELQISTLVARKLAPINMAVCASPDYLSRYGVPQHPQDLKQHRVLRYTLGTGSVWTFIAPGGKQVSTGINEYLSANNGDFLCDAAIDGLGIVGLPTFILWKAIEKGELVPILTDYTVESLNAYAVYPGTKFLPHRARALIDFFVDRFKDQPYWDR